MSCIRCNGVGSYEVFMFTLNGQEQQREHFHNMNQYMKDMGVKDWQKTVPHTSGRKRCQNCFGKFSIAHNELVSQFSKTKDEFERNEIRGRLKELWSR